MHITYLLFAGYAMDINFGYYMIHEALTSVACIFCCTLAQQILIDKF